MKKALVLSGGGALGSYQIGVWKALRELNIKFDIVTGTSVGALNGAWVVQNQYKEALKMWKNVSFGQLFSDVKPENEKANIGRKARLKIFAKNFIENGGMDTEKLEKEVAKHVKYNKIINSKIDYGITTVKFPTLKPVNFKKNELTEENLNKFIVASAACFPIYQTQEINNSEYMDGGYRSHLPIELAIEMGAEEIIAVDLFGISKTKVKKYKNTKIVYITPNNNIGSFMEFSKRRSKMNIKLGYNDTMKIFGALEGNKYTFKRNTLDKNLKKYEKDLKANIEDVFRVGKKRNIFEEGIFKVTDYYKMINNDDYLKKTVYSAIEYNAKSFKINPAEIYSMRRLNRFFRIELEELNIKRLLTIEKKIETRDVSNLFSSKVIIKFMYSRLEKMGNSRKKRKELSKLALLLPKEFICALYLYTINHKKKNLLSFFLN